MSTYAFRSIWLSLGFMFTILIGMLAYAETPPVYNHEGKIDPFAPLFQEKRVKFKLVEKVIKPKPKLKFIPLCKWHLNQMNLVATIVGTEHKFATWEVPTGSSYSAKVGDFVGKEGLTVEVIGLGYVQLSNGEIIKTNRK